MAISLGIYPTFPEKPIFQYLCSIVKAEVAALATDETGHKLEICLAARERSGLGLWKRFSGRKTQKNLSPSRKNYQSNRTCLGWTWFMGQFWAVVGAMLGQKPMKIWALREGLRFLAFFFPKMVSRDLHGTWYSRVWETFHFHLRNSLNLFMIYIYITL